MTPEEDHYIETYRNYKTPREREIECDIARMEVDLAKVKEDLVSLKNRCYITSVGISYLQKLSFEGRPDEREMTLYYLDIIACRLHYLGVEERELSTLARSQAVLELTIENLKRVSKRRKTQ